MPVLSASHCLCCSSSCVGVRVCCLLYYPACFRGRFLIYCPCFFPASIACTTASCDYAMPGLFLPMFICHYYIPLLYHLLKMSLCYTSAISVIFLDCASSIAAYHLSSASFTTASCEFCYFWTVFLHYHSFVFALPASFEFCHLSCVWHPL